MTNNSQLITNNHRKSFTLIELLVVLALVAILSVVVVITLNPAELLKQARDSNRLSDLATINTALNLFSTDVTSGFMGTSTLVYVSLPDNSSSTCGSWGLPALPVGYTYNCATTANLRNTDGTGWIPVNLQRISSNSPISQLPIDPINTTSSGNYYTYVTGGSWMLSAIPESQKQKTELSSNPHMSKFPGVIGMGNNLDLSPLYNPNGLVGYWKFDEGGGAVAKDSSGQGNNCGLGSYSYAGGKVGSFSFYCPLYAGNLSCGTNGMPTSSNPFSLSAWLKPTSGMGWGYALRIGTPGMGFQSASIGWQGGSLGAQFWDAAYGSSVSDYSWHFVTFAYGGGVGGSVKVYVDGLQVNSSTATSNMGTSSPAIAVNWANGVDDARIYNRALSAAEVMALYNATK